MNEDWMHDDELTEEDLRFLSAFEAVEESGPGTEDRGDRHAPDEDGDVIIEYEAPESDSSDSDSHDEHGESDQIDESTMDLSEIETEVEPETSSESSPESDEPDHLEDGASDDIHEGEDDLDYDPDLEYDAEADAEAQADAKSTETEDWDENDDEADAESLPEANGNEDGDQESEEGDQTPSADAEKDFEGDAQKELEEHLEAEADKDEPESDPEPPEDDPKPKGEEIPSGDFSGVPEPSDRCTNHCEDNPEEETEHESCPHCIARIEQERELWGAVATDMHGQDLFPGDKVVVRTPVSFVMHGTMVTVNVPNHDVDPERVAEKTSGDAVDDLWLSGRGISQFTGYRMSGAKNPVWTFEKGTQIQFVERADYRPKTDDEVEAEIEEFMSELDELGETEHPAEPDSEIEVAEAEEEVEDVEEDEDDEKPDEKSGRNGLTSAQRKRFEKLFDRFVKKIEGTFGNTLEKIEKGDIQYNDGVAMCGLKIQSRGTTYTFGFVARKGEF